ncbi:MAG: S1C family serine protease [Treponema sp.]|nr:S1C family serine protease [Treponema sp.]
MKKTSFLALVLACQFFSSFFLSCASRKLPTAPDIDFDYTQKDVHDAEVKRIYELLQKNPLEALWRAKLLDDQKLCDECASYARDSLKAHLEQGDEIDVWTIYNSLKTAGYSEMADKVIDEDKAKSLYFDGVPGLSSGAQPALEKISDYIQGTVTVWVDLGVKVENGMGYAARVIGSGFFIDPRGYIVTNHHVIEEIVNPKNPGYGKVYIKMAEDSDQRIPAKVVGYDSVHDLALLKTEAKVPYVFNLGAQSQLNVGSVIYAIGSPLGLERTLTSGVVSSADRKLFTTGSVVQIDAAINSGNSGGPCIDKNGVVQGIVFAGIAMYQGLNFAIPIEYLKQDLPILYRGGQRHFPWIGAFGKTARAGRTPYGLEVQYVKPGSAMARAGMKAGDVITSLAGKKVQTLENVQDILRDYVPGSIVSCSYLQNGSYEAQKECLLFLTERPKNPGYEIYQGDTIQHSFTAIFGMEMKPASTVNSRTFTVVKVLPGSAADENGFSENDPVTVSRIQFNDDKSAILAAFTTKNRRNGYLDISIAMQAMLDSPYYF